MLCCLLEWPNDLSAGLVEIVQVLAPISGAWYCSLLLVVMVVIM